MNYYHHYPQSGTTPFETLDPGIVADAHHSQVDVSR